ncbi:HAD family hydrolase [Gracilibacillus kekensis]|uniref:Putative hydrolase of the HAD superfamily n=1 Tax=Gracilibacillus kekensis TaxID=1027249 RepID=A0A1M7J0C8_9BACI|nr:HAD family hydrolase [Gracilibacillus kekensis]SHM45887.1 putative hydrolase of the HAD superfamily [Gracilibacillus kekensis]
MIFFDIDGTLLDHEQAEKLAALEFYNACSSDIKCNNRDEFLVEWYTLSVKYYQEYLEKKLSFQEQRRMRMKDVWRFPIKNEEADDLFIEYIISYKRNWFTFLDVVPCLQRLKGSNQKIGIISNGEHQQQLEKLNQMDISSYFDVVVTSDSTGVAKPDKSIFLEACKKAKCKPEESYYIGDRIETDALASKHAGMKGIWLNRKNSSTHSEVSVIHSLNGFRIERF